MVRQLVAPVLLAVLIPPAFAQPCVPCPQGYGVVILPALPPGCLPAMGVVETKPPVVIPERMEAPKKEKGVQLDPPKKEEFATPKPADTPKPPPVKPDPEKIVPVIGEKIAPPGVPPLPPSKSDFDFVPPLTDPKTDDKPKPVEAPKPPEKLQPFDIPLPKPGDAQPVEANKPTVAKSSPLSGEREASAVDIYPRAGAAAGKGRAVTFVNKSSRDILLTVDGKTTTLPSKTVMTAELGEKFKWQIGGEAERTETVPDGRSGVDVVIRR